MFVGTHTVGIDAKGRLSVPATFRAALKGADHVFVWPSYRGAFLEGGDAAWLARLHASLTARADWGLGHDDIGYAIFAEARMLTLDETGRASLPEDLRLHAGLNGKAAFAGLSDRFEIWAPDALAARVAQARAAAAEGRAVLTGLTRETAP